MLKISIHQNYFKNSSRYKNKSMKTDFKKGGINNKIIQWHFKTEIGTLLSLN